MRNGVEDRVAVLVAGQVDRQHLGQGRHQAIEFLDVIDAAEADRAGAVVGQHQRLVQVAIDQGQGIGQRQIIEHQFAAAPGQ
ncbi:hypothetical protein D3C84_1195500 [compost metagenome]